MKKDGLLNPQILSAIAAMGHTEYLVIADAGLPVPSGIPVIDISLIRGIPDFGAVLHSVMGLSLRPFHRFHSDVLRMRNLRKWLPRQRQSYGQGKQHPMPI